MVIERMVAQKVRIAELSSGSWVKNEGMEPSYVVIKRGDKVGLIGPNGCGKTTLLKLLLGELQPDAGTVRRGTKLAEGVHTAAVADDHGRAAQIGDDVAFRLAGPALVENHQPDRDCGAMLGIGLAIDCDFEPRRNKRRDGIIAFRSRPIAGKGGRHDRDAATTVG